MKVATMKIPGAIDRAAAGAAREGAGFWAEGEDGFTVARQVLRAGVWCGACGTVIYGFITLLDMVQSWALTQLAGSLGL